MNVLPIHGLALLPFAALILYSLYRRYRSHVGPQEVKPRRMSLRVLLLGGLAVFLLVTPLGLSPHLELLGGIAAGLALGLLSLHHTRFETRATKHYYIPNIYIGLAVSALFMVRIVYRFAVQYPQMQAGGAALPTLSPADPLAMLGGSHNFLTLLLLGTVIGYYALYYAGVLLLSRRIEMPPSGPAVETDSPG